MAHRVRGPQDGVGEGQAGLQRRLRHQHPGRHVLRPFDGGDQVLGDHHHRAQCVVVGELIVPERDERLDTVRQGIQTRCGIEPFGHGGEQPRVDGHTAAQHADATAGLV